MKNRFVAGYLPSVGYVPFLPFPVPPGRRRATTDDERDEGIFAEARPTCVSDLAYFTLAANGVNTQSNTDARH